VEQSAGNSSLLDTEALGGLRLRESSTDYGLAVKCWCCCVDGLLSGKAVMFQQLHHWTHCEHFFKLSFIFIWTFEITSRMTRARTRWYKF
jgi:hypothetical protein